ncbi:glutathione S-transferase family protein [Kiloniella laminariae]|uniref:glutathione transferase n=1 Tax=Kiloniella laminariae TaxID=454162 RepID=A0ABT4LEJ5_9PROT|nr:glutathione S-transferase family protein [Kiloniella laminariae]MCZ4279515.1 glutathione S-transferase family protein [Kiloniella laminariae]
MTASLPNPPAHPGSTTEQASARADTRVQRDNELELVSFNLCPYVQRAIILLTEKGIPHKRTYIDLSNKPDWFRKISPLGKVPLLRTATGVLFESSVICEYLDETSGSSLHPSDPFHKARHRSWIEFASSILAAIAGFYSAPTPQKLEEQAQLLTEKFRWLEQNLTEHSYFSDNHFRLVDAAFAPVFRYFDVFEMFYDFDFFQNTPKVRNYRTALSLRSSVKSAVRPDYPDLLLAFLKRKNSSLSIQIPDQLLVEKPE